MVKRKGFHVDKCLTTLTNGCKQRRVEWSTFLAEWFSECSLCRLDFQDEKDFPLQIPTNNQNNCVYFSGSKNDINPNSLFHEGNKFTKKVTGSSVVSWNGISKPFFVGESNLKSNSRSHLEHLRNDLIPAIKELYPNNTFIFIQDSAPSHRAKIVQTFLQQELKCRFVANMEWPPSSPDCNPSDYYLWNEVKEKIYSGHNTKPFESEKELQGRICSVWDQCTENVELLHKAIKQFLPHLKAVVTKEGRSIKTVLG